MLIVQDMSAGRALDLLATLSKTPRPSIQQSSLVSGTAPPHRLALFNLSSSPTAPRPFKARELNLAESMAGQVEEGTLVVLVRDWIGGAS